MIKEALGLITEALKTPTAAWRVLVAFVITMHVAWACSWLPGISGFALAADLEASKLETNSRLSSIEAKQDISLRLALAAEICRIQSLRNATADAVMRAQLNRSFDEKQEQYASVNRGARYPIAECPQ